MKNVMVRAWEIAKEGQVKFGGKVSEYFAQALAMAWAEVKAPLVAELQTLSGSRKHKTWVAKITGKHPQYKFNRTFVEATDGNMMYKVFHLEDGVYDVCDGGTRKYISVVNGIIHNVDEYAVAAAL